MDTDDLYEKILEFDDLLFDNKKLINSTKDLSELIAWHLDKWNSMFGECNG